MPLDPPHFRSAITYRDRGWSDRRTGLRGICEKDAAEASQTMMSWTSESSSCESVSSRGSGPKLLLQSEHLVPHHTKSVQKENIPKITTKSLKAMGLAAGGKLGKQKI